MLSTILPSQAWLIIHPSEDHRGTAISPGRVVTLIERSYWSKLGEQVSTDEPDKVYGAAYRIPSEHVEEVKAYLDIREINGYSVQYTTFFPLADPSRTSGSEKRSDVSLDLPRDDVRRPIENCLVYIGLPNNPQFLGLQDSDDVAKVIARSEGPSGKNIEYLFMLEKALEELHARDKVQDRHIGDLAERVRRRLASNERLGQIAAAKELRRTKAEPNGASTEETEKTIVVGVAGD